MRGYFLRCTASIINFVISSFGPFSRCLSLMKRKFEGQPKISYIFCDSLEDIDSKDHLKYSLKDSFKIVFICIILFLLPLLWMNWVYKMTLIHWLSQLKDCVFKYALCKILEIKNSFELMVIGFLRSCLYWTPVLFLHALSRTVGITGEGGDWRLLGLALVTSKCFLGIVKLEQQCTFEHYYQLNGEVKYCRVVTELLSVLESQ